MSTVSWREEIKIKLNSLDPTSPPSQILPILLQSLSQWVCLTVPSMYPPWISWSSPGPTSRAPAYPGHPFLHCNQPLGFLQNSPCLALIHRIFPHQVQLFNPGRSTPTPRLWSGWCTSCTPAQSSLLIWRHPI